MYSKYDNSRRNFLKEAAACASWAICPSQVTPFSSWPTAGPGSRQISITGVNTTFEREPLATPYGFKGGYMRDVWQTVVRLESDSGRFSIGLGTQNVLWSDAEVFANHSESGGNALMYALTEHALQRVQGQGFASPIALLDEILEEVYHYGKQITGNAHLRQTFALNALVALDNAAWLLYAYENNLRDFDALVPAPYRAALSHRHTRVISAPAFSFATPVAEMKKLVEEGYFMLKLKLGHPGAQSDMLQRDMDKLTVIHQTIGQQETPHTPNRRLPYYLDLNGRYATKDTLLRLLDHAQKIGAFDQILMVEEPFPEENTTSVADLGVMVAADESAHTDKDVAQRIQMGYGAIALKPIAKTLSMTLKMARTAYEQKIPCFCADLTVNPILVDWNKNVAARLPALPGFAGMGLMENNGHQNYRNWDKMLSYHPYPEASWIKAQEGVFVLDDSFYQQSGGIFALPAHYVNLFATAR